MASAGGRMTVHVKTTAAGGKFSVEVEGSLTVAEFKALLADKSSVPAPQQRLIYKGHVLKDDRTLASYGLEHEHTVHLVKGAARDENSSGAAPSTATSSTVPAPGLGIPNVAGMPLGAGGDMASMQQQLLPFLENPQSFQQLANSPAVQAVMNNPDIMRMIVNSNPQLREIMDRNPELAHIMNDPSILRQTLEAARNPELMREMMRTTDRAMSNIEAHPEGFNALRRMYENVQEPIMNSATQAAANAVNRDNPFSALFNTPGTQPAATPVPAPGPNPNTNPLPNPWNPRPAATAPAAGTGATAPARPASNTPSPFGLLPGMGAGMPSMDTLGMDPQVMGQMLQDPAYQQMIQQVMSNPQVMEQVLNMNPQMRQMMESNPMLSDFIRNPEFLRQMSNPQFIQAMLQLQQALSNVQAVAPNFPLAFGTPLGGDAGAAAGGLPAAAGAAPPNMNALLSTLMGGGLGGAVPQPNVPPETLYANQLAQLQEMGFFDTQANIQALAASGGNVHAAVEQLLQNLG
eukprot:jgi/Chlat1/7082/Chrsp57S06778